MIRNSPFLTGRKYNIRNRGATLKEGIFDGDKGENRCLQSDTFEIKNGAMRKEGEKTEERTRRFQVQFVSIPIMRILRKIADLDSDFIVGKKRKHGDLKVEYILVRRWSRQKVECDLSGSVNLRADWQLGKEFGKEFTTLIVAPNQETLGGNWFLAQNLESLWN